MVDIHCHLLPGVDDGAGDWDECLEMGRVAAADGITVIVATPHWPQNNDAPDAARVRDLVAEVQQAFDDEGIAIHVYPGHELVILPEAPDELAAGNALGIAGTMRYALMETPYHHLPYYLREIIFQIQSRGFTPVIAHPERNPIIQAKPETLNDYIDSGCLVQVTAGSILGQFGAPSKRAAEYLMRQGWCHVIASDAHSTSGRPPALHEAMEAAATLIGEDAAQRAVTTTPADIVAGNPVRIVPVVLQPAKATGLGGALKRLFGRSR
jgi:protein-tyrosine phosphatase